MNLTLTTFLLEAFDVEVSQRAATATPRKTRLGRLREGIAAYGRLLQDLASDPDTAPSDREVLKEFGTLIGAPRQRSLAA